MDRRAHYLLRAAAIAVLVVEAVLPHRGSAHAPASASTEVKSPALVAGPPAPAVPSTPVAMR